MLFKKKKKSPPPPQYVNSGQYLIIGFTVFMLAFRVVLPDSYIYEFNGVEQDVVGFSKVIEIVNPKWDVDTTNVIGNALKID